ncbi:MFS transporter [Sphaerisporangium perillae]|uniref:MFS transporter n=1 Tax=Sphaerisporangium perillae TaxID=2935860 RepID=UPI002010C031|nr:MFS transporter [Sphaerisporangium perillae]
MKERNLLSGEPGEGPHGLSAEGCAFLAGRSEETDRHSTTGFDAAGRRVLVVCALGGFTTLLDNSVLNIAIPALRGSLHADATQLQWMVAGYSLAFGLALIPGGRLGDVRGASRFFSLVWRSSSWAPRWQGLPLTLGGS